MIKFITPKTLLFMYTNLEFVPAPWVSLPVITGMIAGLPPKWVDRLLPSGLSYNTSEGLPACRPAANVDEPSQGNDDQQLEAKNEFENDVSQGHRTHECETSP